jgi:hypothetical protein
MLAALKLPLAVNAGGADALLRVLLTYIAPVGLLVAFVGAGLRCTREPGAMVAVEPGGAALSG